MSQLKAQFTGYAYAGRLPVYQGVKGNNPAY